jgi:hypothetical protein
VLNWWFLIRYIYVGYIYNLISIQVLQELILDEQFAKLEELEGEDDPNFAENFANIYLSESTKYIDTIEQTL